MPIARNVKDILEMNTAEVCGYYINGKIDVIPKIHIDKMIKMLTRDMRRLSKLGDSDPKLINYIRSCHLDNMFMITRYLKLTYYRRDASKKYYSTKYLRETTRDIDVVDEYYKSIIDYCIGSIEFEGKTLDIYYNVPSNSKHDSLTCFHSNLESTNEYFFKNLGNVLPSAELTDEFLLQLSSQLPIDNDYDDYMHVVKYSF